MKIRGIVRGVAVSLAAWAICLPSVVFSAEQAPALAVVDIAMADGGILHGQVVDLQGGNAVGVPVVVKAQNQSILRTVTSKEGRFEVQNLKGGVYQVAAGEGQGVYRVWSAKAAPPSAQKTAIVYTQHGGSTLKSVLTNPIVIAGVVATAIAVPIALANDHDDSP